MEKKNIKLRILTLSDLKRFNLKRFKSRALHNIINKMRTKNENISLQELAENKEYVKMMRYAVRGSLIKRADKHQEKQKQKLEEKYLNKEKIEKEALDNTLINQKQYDRQMKYNEYRKKKELYEKDLSDEVQEKPENPRFKGIKKAIKTVGKTIGKVVTFPFVLGAKGVSKLIRGTKVNLLTAGKFYNQYKEMKEEVTLEEETKDVSSKMNKAKTLEKKDEIYQKANEKVQSRIVENVRNKTDEKSDIEGKNRYINRQPETLKQTIINEDYESAKQEYEEEKRRREAERRRNLHLDEEPQEIQDVVFKSYVDKIDRRVSLKNKQKEFKKAPEEIQSKIRRKDWEEAKKENEEIEGQKILHSKATIGEIIDEPKEDERDL